MMDWESHRILTRTGKFRGLVFTLTHSFVVKLPLGLYASKVTTHLSEKQLNAWVRKRGWRLERARHFS
jgi:hypothetical protein